MMDFKSAARLIRFKDLKPQIGLPRVNEPGFFRPMYRYVGPNDNWAVTSTYLEFHMTYLPVGASSSAFHWTPGAHAAMMCLTGKALFWDGLGNEAILEPYDTIYMMEHPYNYRNIGREGIWFAHPMAPAANPPGTYYDKGPPPSRSEKISKGMADIMEVVKFKDMKAKPDPIVKASATSFTPRYSYVGLESDSRIRDPLLDFSLIYVPAGVSCPPRQYSEQTEVLMVVLDGRVVFENEEGSVELEPFDGMFFKGSSNAFRNQWKEGTWIALSYSPALADA